MPHQEPLVPEHLTLAISECWNKANYRESCATSQQHSKCVNSIFQSIKPSLANIQFFLRATSARPLRERYSYMQLGGEKSLVIYIV